MHESAYSTIPNSNPSTKAFAEAEMTFRSTCVEIKIYGAFVLNQRDVLHAIDATPARWRGDAGSSPLDQARNGRVIECTRHC